MNSRERWDLSPDWNKPARSLEFHLLGVVDFRRVLDLQRRLVAAAAAGLARSLPILLCEHPNRITIGRCGSSADIRWSREELQRRNMAVQWVARGGPTVVHAPGQLCVYPIVPLQQVGWTVGQYLQRLRQALIATIHRLHLSAELRDGTPGVWGRSGMLAAIGLRVQDGIAHHGAFLNVCPDMSQFGYVDTAAGQPQSTMSSLVAERRGAVRMATVRSCLIECLAEAWQSEQHFIHAGHPWLAMELGAHRRTPDLA